MKDTRPGKLFLARELIDKDPMAAAYAIMMRLDEGSPYYDLAWALSHDGSCHRNDVYGLIEYLPDVVEVSG